MTASRIDIFEQMLAREPGNTSVLFGLAKEYEKAGRDEKLIETLNRYVEAYDDEGNAFGMLAGAYERLLGTGRHNAPAPAESRPTDPEVTCLADEQAVTTGGHS